MILHDRLIKKVMKIFKTCLPLLAIALSSLSPRPSEISGSRVVNGNTPFGSQVILSYVGSMSATGMAEQPIGIMVYIDTTIGVRYEVSINRAGPDSHVGIFYKFSKPYQTVVYNFNTHKSFVNKGNGSSDSDPNLDVIGKETVNGYVCTHLQNGGGTKRVTDYWMSTKLPGFSKLVNTLKTINPDLPGMAFNGTIFNWGGLVKWRANAAEEKGTVSLELNLREANTDVTLSAKTFDVPSK